MALLMVFVYDEFTCTPFQLNSSENLKKAQFNYRLTIGEYAIKFFQTENFFCIGQRPANPEAPWRRQTVGGEMYKF